jgi:putative transposase
VCGIVKNRSFAKYVSCASFGQFRQILTYKCAWYGRELRILDRFFPSSKRCNFCGHIHANLSLNMRKFDCENCGEHLDRDINAAKNILQFAGGQPVKGRGESVRPVQTGSSQRSVNQSALCNV